MFKARMKFAKEGRAKYISHLDLMHTMQRAMARCQMPLWFTEGFNQHAYVSIALPLSTGYSGECEFLDFNITSEAVPENAVESRLGWQILKRLTGHPALAQFAAAADEDVFGEKN